MELKQLDKKALSLWLVRNVIVSAVLTLVFVLATVLADAGKVRLAVAISTGIPIFIAVAALIAYPYFKYALYKFGYDEKKIIVRKGVIFRKKIIIPTCQIQDLHRFEGPLMQLFKLSGVEISTAGSNFHLACLCTENADKMITELEAFLEARIEEQNNEEV